MLENTGTATILAGHLFVSVPHGLDAAPIVVTVNPSTDVLGKRWWEDPSDRTGTAFVIRIDSAAEQDISFTWSASTVAPPAPDDLITTGPCQAWIDGTDVATYCAAEASSSGAMQRFDDAAVMASNMLYEWSGRRYPGICTSVVRPCRQGCGCWITQVSERTWVWAGPGGAGYPAGSWFCEDTQERCGCGVEYRVKLAGYPIQQVSQVTIGGDIVDATTYRLQERRYLQRLNGYGGWPQCQDMSLTADQPGTFQIIYQWGMAPPLLGVHAASQLACRIADALDPNLDNCELPANAVQVIRQNLSMTLDKDAMAALPGMNLVAEFLRTVNPRGQRRRSAIFSPDKSYPRRAS